MSEDAILEVEAVYVAASAGRLLPDASRFIGHDGHVALFIEVNPKSPRNRPFPIDLQDFLTALDGGDVVRTEDPFSLVPNFAPRLPEGAKRRLNALQTVLKAFHADTSILYSPWGMARFLEKQGALLDPKRSRDTLQRWFYIWLRAGKKLPAIAMNLVEKERKPQIRGNRRGRSDGAHPKGSKAPAYELMSMMDMAYKKYVVKERLTVEESYGRLVGDAFSPEGATRVFVQPADVQEVEPTKFPSLWQWQEAVRSFRKRDAPPSPAPGIGDRGGSARKYAIGPGHFEIDSTGFQIQLVSRRNGRNLISKPWVYLVTDVFSGLIVGYLVTLENPSWAALSMCLHNCFNDKAPTFARLGLPFSQEVWPCQHLPISLRADRFELISNNGHRFPESMIRVEVTPSRVPQAKGTVEGLNAQIKNNRTKDRYGLVGLYNKFRERGETDGKDRAALTLQAFEKILVLIILDLNMRPVRAARIPDDADPKVVKSRMDLWRWGLKHRAGYTTHPSTNFSYEYLLARSERATISPVGISFQGELYVCDKLREFGMVQSAPHKGRPIVITYHANFAGEIFFEGADKRWHSVSNIDATVGSRGLSFREMSEHRDDVEAANRQAIVDWAAQRSNSAELAKQIVEEELKKTKDMAAIGGVSKVNVISNRQVERRAGRAAQSSGIINSIDASSGKSVQGQPASQAKPRLAGTGLPGRRAVSNFDKDENHGK